MAVPDTYMRSGLLLLAMTYCLALCNESLQDGRRDCHKLLYPILGRASNLPMMPRGYCIILFMLGACAVTALPACCTRLCLSSTATSCSHLGR